MADRSFLSWPFLEEKHTALYDRVEAWAKAHAGIMHGEDDAMVPIDQAHEMATALKKAGHPPETLYLDRVGHWWPGNKQGVVFLVRLEAFLAANLGK